MRSIQAILVFSFLVGTHISQAQISFTDQTASLDVSNTSTFLLMGVADMDNDLLDDIIRFDSGQVLNIEYQTASGFINKRVDSLPSPQWAVCIGDFDKNGYNDILTGGEEDSLKLYTADNTGDQFTKSFITDEFFLQGVNFVDINNDGWIDIFACNDDSTNYVYRNNGSGLFIRDANLILTNPSAGNYASLWCDYDNDSDLDLYISKCRQGVNDNTDERRINLLYQNNGMNQFTNVAPSANVADGAQTWAADFADIDNDGDMDLFIINHFDSCRLFENDGSGNFTDITASSGILFDPISQYYQVTFQDFDNDKYVDLLIGGDEPVLYHNNGDKSFTPMFVSGIDSIITFATGDLNNDGFVDIYAGYNLFGFGSKRDRLLINGGNANNYLAIGLNGFFSNKNGIGARIHLYSNGIEQLRDVRSGEGYCVMNSLTQYFGLSTDMIIDSIIVDWPSWVTQRLYDVGINQTLVIKEEDGLIGMGEPDILKTEILVVPNPADDSWIIVLGSEFNPDQEKADLVMFNSLGKEVRRQTICSGHKIERNELAAGLYFCILSAGDIKLGSAKIVLR